ncbi:MAG: ComEC/Rec2 family competence protein [Bacillota bacterium]|nr:ComEC/Rec2 family competence protein [Bacillota bacterium]
MNIDRGKLSFVSLAFFLGVLLFKYSLIFSLCYFIITILLIIIYKNKALFSLILLAIFILGGLYTGHINKNNLSRAQKYLDAQKTYNGRVVSIPKDVLSGQSSIIDIGDVKIKLTSSGSVVSYGDVITFNAKPYIPEGKGYILDYDYRTYLKSQGVYLCAYTSDVNVIGNQIFRFSINDQITRLRIFLLNQTDKLFSGEVLMFMRGFLLGNSDLSSDEFRETLSNGGISHVVAISGMHVALIAAALFYILKRVALRKKYLYLIIIPFIWAFVLLTGAFPSSVRAGIMVSILVLSKSLLKNYDSFNALSLSALIILLINPFTAFSSSFLLSYLAVVGMLTFEKSFERLFPKVGKVLIPTLCVTLSAQVFTLPVLAIFFGRVTVLGLLTNIIAVPLVPLIMLLGYAALFLSFIYFPTGLIFSYSCGLIVKLCLKAASFFGSLKGSYIDINFTNKYLLIFLYLSFVAFLYFGVLKRKKLLGFISVNLSLILLILCIVFPLLNQGQVYVDYMDVGQGDCTLVTCGTYSVMLDVNTESKLVENTIIPYMRCRGASFLDVMIISDYNNIESCISLLNLVKVNTLVLPEGEAPKLLLEAVKKHTKIIYVNAGDEISAGPMQFKVVYGTEGSSLAVLLKANSRKIMFPGSINESQEHILAKSISDIDILKAPRNGALTSCTDDLLKKASPELIIVSTASSNNPSKSFMDRIKKHHASYYVTHTNRFITTVIDKDGTINTVPYGEEES